MRPPSLHEVQRGFWRSIAERPGCSRSDFDPGLIAAVRPDAHLESTGRIQVYADAYFLRLRDVLTEDFPTVAKILGAEKFERLAQDYLRAFPSEHPSVRHLGRAMAEYIGSRSDLPSYLADLAQSEWAMIDAFDAPNSSPLTAEGLREIEAERWPNLKFTPIPSLRVIRSGWPVHLLWSEDEAGDICACAYRSSGVARVGLSGSARYDGSARSRSPESPHERGALRNDLRRLRRTAGR